MSSKNSQHTFASIGLSVKSPDVADVSFDWGGASRFHEVLLHKMNATDCWNKWGHLTRNKLTAPYAVWGIFAAGSEGRKGDVLLAKTALAFDIDEGNVSEKSLQAALRELRWESAFYTTWSAKPDNLRWRVVIPLATPHTIEGWDDFYQQKLTEFTRVLEVHHGSSVTLDKTAKVAVQPHILPHETPSMFLNGMTEKKLRDILEKMAHHKDGPPGFGLSTVYGTCGAALTHSSPFILVDGARRKLNPADFFTSKGAARAAAKAGDKAASAAEQERAKAAAKVERKDGHKASGTFTEVVVYAGSYTSAEGREAAEGWLEKGIQHTPKLVHAIDGALYLSEFGIRVRVGNRQGALIGALWGLHRAGWQSAEIMQVADRIIFSSKPTDQAYLCKEAAKYLEKTLIPLEKAAAKMESAIYAALARKGSEGAHVGSEPKRRFARIISRAKHCYSAEGGKLCQEQIAECIGLGKSWNIIGGKVVRAFLGHCERAGLIIATGEKSGRTYRLVPPVGKES